MEWTVSLEDMVDFSRAFWEAARGARLFALYGPMGAGKTTIVSALCRALGVDDAPSSPTFSIINEYAYTKNGVPQTLYHIDLYRLRDDEEIVQAGVEDCVFGERLCFVEWPEKAPWLFDDATARVLIEPLDDGRRRVQLKMPAAL